MIEPGQLVSHEWQPTAVGLVIKITKAQRPDCDTVANIYWVQHRQLQQKIFQHSTKYLSVLERTTK